VPLDATVLGPDGVPVGAGIVTADGRTLVRLKTASSVAPGTVIEAVRPDGTVVTGSVTVVVSGPTPAEALAAAGAGTLVLLAPSAGGWTAAVVG